MKNPCLAFMFTLLVAPLLHAQTEYTLDGVPNALEEEFRWIINRGRYDSAAENLARGTSYSDIPSSCGPLAPHASLTLAARHHSEDMATFNFFSHTTEESLYYAAGSTFLDRISDEGYVWSSGGEVIAAGSGTDVTPCYLLWWNSEPHRQNMYNGNFGEIGCGHFFNAAADYRNYYTIDFGARSAVNLFTGTLFEDSSGDGEYDQGEGVSGIKIIISVGGVATGWYDVSGGNGSFAVPIADVPLGTEAKVQLQNTNSISVTLAVPVDYSTHNYITLSGGESIDLGTFIRTASVKNIGFRDLAPPSPMPVASIWHAVEVAWASVSGTVYQVEWASALDTNQWYNLGDPVIGNGDTNSVFSRTSGISQRFFRVVVP